MTLLWTLLLLVALGLPVAAHAAHEALAEVDGVAITAEEVDWALGAQLTKLHAWQCITTSTSCTQ
jgi:hypothetical protein